MPVSPSCEYRPRNTPATSAAAHRSGDFVKEHAGMLAGHRPDWELVVGPSKGRYRNEGYERVVTWRDRNAPAARPTITSPVSRPARTTAEPRPGSNRREYSNRFEQMTAMWPLVLLTTPICSQRTPTHASNRASPATGPPPNLCSTRSRAARPLGRPRERIDPRAGGQERRRTGTSGRRHCRLEHINTARRTTARDPAVRPPRVRPKSVPASSPDSPSRRASRARRNRRHRLLTAALRRCPNAATPTNRGPTGATRHPTETTVALPKSLIDIATNKPNSMLGKACRRVPCGPLRQAPWSVDVTRSHST